MKVGSVVDLMTASILSTGGSFNHVYAELVPRADAMEIAWIALSAVSSVTILLLARSVINGSSMIGTLAAAAAFTASRFAIIVSREPVSPRLIRRRVLAKSSRSRTMAGMSYAVT